MSIIIENRKIYLVGMMGSGKSFWSGKLGQYFAIPAYDLDRLLEREAGKSIREIFAADGEVAFRNREAALLRQGVVGSKFILACGGGTPCFHDNMAFMKTKGIVVWLKPSINELVSRVSRSIETRPVLEGHQSPEALKLHLETLLEKRHTWYSQADIVVEDDATVQQIAGQIISYEHETD